MTLLIFLQLAYGVLAILFNLASLSRLKAGRGQLTPTPPVAGIKMMTFVLLVTLSYYLWWPLHVAGWLYLLWFVGRGGIGTHARALKAPGTPPGYASRGAAIAAMSLNIFGMVMGALGLLTLLIGAF